MFNGYLILALIVPIHMYMQYLYMQYLYIQDLYMQYLYIQYLYIQYLYIQYLYIQYLYIQYLYIQYLYMQYLYMQYLSVPIHTVPIHTVPILLCYEIKIICLQYKVSEDRLKSSTLWVSVWDNEGVLAHNLFLGETSICFESHEFDDTPLREFSYKLTDYSTMPMMPRSEHGMKYRVYSGRNAHSAELDELEETKPVPFVEAEVEKVTTEENLAAGNGEAEVEPVEAIPTKEEADEEKSAPPDVHEEEPKTLEGEAQVEEPAEMLEEQLVEAVPTQQLESTLEADPVEVKSKKDDKKEKKEREKREKKERKEKEKEQKRKKRSSKVPEEATLSPDPEPVDVQEEEPAQPQEGEIREEQVVPEEGGEVHVAPPVAITLEADPEVKSKSDDKKEKKEREKREKKEKKEKEKDRKGRKGLPKYLKKQHCHQIQSQWMCKRKNLHNLKKERYEKSKWSLKKVVKCMLPHL